MSGITHPYYAVALAPAIAGLLGTGVQICWQRRAELPARLTLAAMLVATGIWDYVLLTRTPTFLPWLKFAVLAVGLVAAGFLLLGRRRLTRLISAVILTTVLALGLGSTAYAVSTASQTHSGSIPTSGPSSSAMGGGCGGTPPGGKAGGPGGSPPGQSTTGTTRNPGTGTTPRQEGPSATGGGPGGGEQADSALAALLSKTTSTWAAAAGGSQSAASLELASGKSVIGIGGWSGSDNAPTLAQFKQYVAEGKIAYYISGGQGGGGGRGRGGGRGQGGSTSSASEIQAWVAANYTATAVGNSTVYSLIG